MWVFLDLMKYLAAQNILKDFIEMLPQQQPNADPKIKGQIIYYLVLTFMADLHQDKNRKFFSLSNFLNRTFPWMNYSVKTSIQIFFKGMLH